MTAVLGKFDKQPAEILDYDVDFTDWFTNRTDAPSSHVATADDGITIVSATRSGNVVKVILSGGTSGTSYKITVRLTTTAALVKEADFVVKIKEV
jgi:hypothetical protein